MERWDKITMDQVSKLINRNKETAAALNLRLSFGITNKKFYGVIFNNDQKIFYNIYEGEHAHILIAMIHADFADHLKKISEARKRAESLRTKEEAKAKRDREEEEAWQAELERRKARFEK